MQFKFSATLITVTLLIGSLFSPIANSAQTATIDSLVTTAPSTAEKVSINSATNEQFVKILQGIGAKKAQAIIDYRKEYGPFTSIEQLREVPGFGDKLFQLNQHKLTL